MKCPPGFLPLFERTVTTLIFDPEDSGCGSRQVLVAPWFTIVSHRRRSVYPPTTLPFGAGTFHKEVTIALFLVYSSKGVVYRRKLSVGVSRDWTTSSRLPSEGVQLEKNLFFVIHIFCQNDF